MLPGLASLSLVSTVSAASLFPAAIPLVSQMRLSLVGSSRLRHGHKNNFLLRYRLSGVEKTFLESKNKENQFLKLERLGCKYIACVLWVQLSANCVYLRHSPVQKQPGTTQQKDKAQPSTKKQCFFLTRQAYFELFY